MPKEQKIDWGLPWDEQTMEAWEAQLRLMSGDKLWELFEYLRTDPTPDIEPLREAFARWMWPPYKTISSAYTGWCRGCGTIIKAGEEIAWAKGGGATHIRCADHYDWPTPERMYPRFRPPRGKGLKCEDCLGHIHVADQADYGHVLCRVCRKIKEERAYLEEVHKSRLARGR